MTRTEHLLTVLAEECCEVAQRATKALRFGAGEVQPGQYFTNASRIALEVDDLLATLELLREEDALGLRRPDRSNIDEKTRKIERFLDYSRECGTLTPDPAPEPTPVDGPVTIRRNSGGWDVVTEHSTYIHKIVGGLTEGRARALAVTMNVLAASAAHATEHDPKPKG